MARPGPSAPEEKTGSSTSLSGTARPLMGAVTVRSWAASAGISTSTAGAASAARSAVAAASRAASSSSPASEARPLAVRA